MFIQILTVCCLSAVCFCAETADFFILARILLIIWQVLANSGKNRKSLKRELQMLFCSAKLELKQKILIEQRCIPGSEKAFYNLI